MRRLLLPLLFLCFVSCTLYPSHYANVPQVADTLSGILSWTYHNVTYKVDPIIQMPDQTYTLRSGDCEDMSLFNIYQLHSIGFDVQLVLFNAEDHTEFRAHLDTGWILFDATTGREDITPHPTSPIYLTYDQAMLRAFLYN